MPSFEPEPPVEPVPFGVESIPEPIPDLVDFGFFQLVFEGP